jgi:hypothetical protein
MRQTHFNLIDRTPVPCSFEAWRPRYGDPEWRVAATETPHGLTISTVFLGLNHCFGEGTPVLFETTVFGSDLDDQPQRRYRTWAEAELGHMEVVQSLEAAAVR